MPTHDSTRPEALEIEVFKTGDYGAKGNYTAEDLDAIAASYKPEFHEAPVTLDHQQSGPAEGWVRSLRRVGNTLYATLQGISPRLNQLLMSGQYKKRSIELFASNKNEAEAPRLKAVTFLGAATPQVKGMSDPLFSEGANVNFLIETEAAEKPHSKEPEAAEALCSFEEFKHEMIREKSWNPIWEEQGLGDFFSELSNDNQRKLRGILQLQGAQTSHAKALPLAFAGQASGPQFHGAATEQSLKRHHQALSFQAQEPTLSYVDALLRVSRLEADCEAAK